MKGKYRYINIYILTRPFKYILCKCTKHQAEDASDFYSNKKRKTPKHMLKTLLITLQPMALKLLKKHSQGMHNFSVIQFEIHPK